MYVCMRSNSISYTNTVVDDTQRPRADVSLETSGKDAAFVLLKNKR